MLAALLALSPACRKSGPSSEPSHDPAASPSLVASAGPPRPPRPISSEALAFERSLQAKKLSLEPQRYREPRLAFGKGVLGQLAEDELRVFDSSSGELLFVQPVPQARLVLALADGTLLAVGAQTMLRVDPATKKATKLAKPVLLPGAELHADAVTPDRVWVFDAPVVRAASEPRPTLSSMLLDPAVSGILLADRSVELELPTGGVLGRTREGVWLYASGEGAERFAPGGARLSKLRLLEQPELLWLLPARRLDQCFVLERRRASRAVVSPSFKQLAGVDLAGVPLTAAAGDEGRLLAVVLVTGEGPRFELQLFDAELHELVRLALPGDAPTGTPDWVKVVTQNQGVAVAPRDGRVAVGGPGRVQVLDARGKRLFSIPSR